MMISGLLVEMGNYVGMRLGYLYEKEEDFSKMDCDDKEKGLVKFFVDGRLVKLSRRLRFMKFYDEVREMG